MVAEVARLRERAQCDRIIWLQRRWSRAARAVWQPRNSPLWHFRSRSSKNGSELRSWFASPPCLVSLSTSVACIPRRARNTEKPSGRLYAPEKRTRTRRERKAAPEEASDPASVAARYASLGVTTAEAEALRHRRAARHEQHPREGNQVAVSEAVDAVRHGLCHMLLRGREPRHKSLVHVRVQSANYAADTGDPDVKAPGISIQRPILIPTQARPSMRDLE